MFTRKNFRFVDALRLILLGIITTQPACAAPAPDANTPPLADQPKQAEVDTPIPADLRRQLALLTAPHQANAKTIDEKSKTLSSVVLDYDKATTSSAEVLNSKVSVTLTDASFLSILDALMDASDKTCRIECRQVRPLRLSLHVEKAPIAGLLDSLAKLGGTRLYVLPSKLLLAPETALSSDEKKTAKLYGVLYTAATLPNTPGAKALMEPNGKSKNIVEFANAKTSVRLSGIAIGRAIEMGVPSSDIRGPYYGVTNGSPILLSDWTSSVSANFQDVRYGDALASLAHLIGYELYLTPTCFVIARPGDISSSPTAPFNTQNTVPAFAPTSVTFSDPSAKES